MYRVYKKENGCGDPIEIIMEQSSSSAMGKLYPQMIDEQNERIVNIIAETLIKYTHCGEGGGGIYKALAFLHEW